MQNINPKLKIKTLITWMASITITMLILPSMDKSCFVKTEKTANAAEECTCSAKVLPVQI